MAGGANDSSLSHIWVGFNSLGGQSHLLTACAQSPLVNRCSLFKKKKKNNTWKGEKTKPVSTQKDGYLSYTGA